MRKNISCRLLVVMSPVFIGTLLSLFAHNVLAQDEKKREKLGSSLKRLKWDEKKGEAVEKGKKEQSDPKAASSINAETLRVETQLAVFDLLVVDRYGRIISGLTKEDFVVTEDNVTQQLSTFATGEAAAIPRSIVLVLDFSGSQSPFLQTSISAAKTLVDQLRPNDKMAIVTDNIELLVDFTKNKSSLKEGLHGILAKALKEKAYGRSQQYSALLAVLRELVNKEAHSIVIFQTDGDQLAYLKQADSPPVRLRTSLFVEFGLADIVAASQRSQTTIYSIISGIRFLGLAPSLQVERAKRLLESRLPYERPASAGYLKQLSNSTAHCESVAAFWEASQKALADVAAKAGGWHEFLEWPEQAQTIYAKILNDINRRYIVGYYPANDSQDGTLRRVRFEVRGHPEYVILGRRAYYASKQ